MTERRPRILIADDEPLFLRTTADLLRKAGYECTCAPDGHAAVEALTAQRFDLLLSDLNMPGNLRLELLQHGRQRWPDMPVIVVTGAPSLPTAIESVRLGIADYLLKPVKYEDLLTSVRRALAYRQHGHVPVANEPLAVGPFPDLIGESPPMLELFEIIERVAPTDTNVLITGESGTGKEAVATAIHRRSMRASAGFQVIDCTAIPETLFESVLFGHAKGSFTGAVKDQIGLLSQADGGTAFIDEVGELPAPLQAKLLRVIQEQTFISIGKTVPQKIDTRFLCATNKDLELEVDMGRFRRDLFYRLAVIHVRLPALRERGEDVLLLAEYFLKKLQPAGQRVTGFTAEAIGVFKRYGWPGNIRELRNAVEHGLAMSRTGEIGIAELPATLLREPRNAPVPATISDAASESRDEAMMNAERAYLVRLLREYEGNVARAAVQAGLSRQGLHKLLKKYDLNAAEFRP